MRTESTQTHISEQEAVDQMGRIIAAVPERDLDESGAPKRRKTSGEWRTRDTSSPFEETIGTILYLLREFRAEISNKPQVINRDE